MNNYIDELNALQKQLEMTSAKDKLDVLKRLVVLTEDENPNQAEKFCLAALEEIKHDPDPVLQGQFLIELIKTYIKLQKYSKASEYSKYCLTLQDEIYGPLAEQIIGQFHSLNGMIYYHFNDYKQALSSFNRSLKFFHMCNRDKEIGEVCRNIALIYQRLGDYWQALDYLNHADDIYSQISDDHGKAKTLNNIGIIHARLKNYNEAVTYYTASLKIREKLNDKIGKSRVYNNLGNALLNLKQFEKSIEYYLKAEKILINSVYKNNLADVYHNLGHIYQKLKNLPLSLKYYQNCLNIRKNIEDRYNYIKVLTNIASVHCHLGSLSEAEKYIRQALDNSKDIESKELSIGLYSTMAEIFRAKQQYLKALEMLKKYGEVKKQVFNEKCNQQMADFQIRYQIDQQQQQIAIYKSKNIRLINANKKLRKAIKQLKILKGLLPICPRCKKIRDDQGYWTQVEEYVVNHSDAEFTHGLCPECAKKFFPEVDINQDQTGE
ncbi:MAG: hypothetical protein APR63_05950 [Desulfuromonas sp. SDB]|nr:MAG: hypothetical protein APR63_05950 [Desulfuromonas sp. SDB]